MSEDSKIFVVETVSIFRHTYYVRARSSVHAEDEVICNLDNGDFIEGSQKHVDEAIVNTIEVTEEEFIKVFDRENDYLSSWTDEHKLNMVNVVDYGKEQQ